MRLKPGLIVLLIVSLGFAQERKDLTMQDVFASFMKYPSFQGEWMPAQDRFVFAKRDTNQQFLLYTVDPLTQDTTLILEGNRIVWGDSTLAVESWSLSPEENHLLIRNGVKRIWRRSRSYVAYVYTFATGKTQVLGQGSRLRNVKFSPDETKVAYVKEDNNLYVYDLEKQREKKITRDGSHDISNGHFGWVYEEEFGTYDGYRWSPDSKYIAFWREDQTAVPEFPLVDYLSTYPSIRYIHYPKVGEANPTMKIGVADVKKGKKRWLDLPAGPDVYYPRLYWLKSDPGHLLVLKLNRLQNHLELWKGSSRTGKMTLFYEERDPAWIDVTDDFHELSDGRILWTSESSGYRHIYLISEDGKHVTPVTRGPWEVTRVVDVDEANDWVYFYSKRHSVIGQHLDRIHLDGSDLMAVTPEDGWHSVRLSPKHSLLIDAWSTASRPTTRRLLRSDGQLVRVLTEPDTADFATYGFTHPTFFQIPTSDDSTLLNVTMTLPRDFDPGRKYPVFIYGYAGPGSQVVVNRWGGFSTYWYQYLAQHDIILFSVDNRGTGGRGKAFKNLAYGDLGKYAAGDHIEAVKYLRSLPYVDPDRIGIWGWSGGGYLTSMCLTKGGDYFSLGVAVAPVIDFRLYDTIWTERYMGTLETNAAGYDSANVLNYIDKLQGKLLIMHGTGDDNVHFQNTIQMVNNCISRDKQMEVFFFPNRNHGIYGDNATQYLYKKMTTFVLENL